MLSPTARVVAFYGGAGLALALMCLTLLHPSGGIGLDAAGRRRLRRRALWLATAGILHPVFACAALVLAKDANRESDSEDTDTAVVAASTSLAVSLTVMVGAFVVAA